LSAEEAPETVILLTSAVMAAINVIPWMYTFLYC
jgi:hypothetical protein